MEENGLIFTFSGIRGIYGKDLNFEIAKKIAISFGKWFDSENRGVIVGRDTRPSGKFIEKGIIEGLVASGFKVVNVGICPTPIIIHTKKQLNLPTGIIITGSHNSPEWNGLKLLSSISYLHNRDLEEISLSLKSINLSNYITSSKVIKQNVQFIKPIPDYINALYNNIDRKKILKENHLRVVLDTGAGAGKCATPQILAGLGCEVKVINNDLLVNDTFPREIEPISKNLKDINMEVWQGKFDVGFAHDSDADRLAIIGENGVCYPEDIGLALITEHFLKNNINQDKEFVFVTNLASSLMFEVIAEKYNAQVIRTQIGEVFLVEKMHNLLNEETKSSMNRYIFGGEGSCGGVMFPDFNNTRDGLFAAAKIIEIMVETEESISKLVSRLPKFFSHRKQISVNPKDVKVIISGVKQELISEGEEVSQYGNDLRFGKEKDWFVLIHPSNTEPIIRVICEAKIDSLARIFCETTTELIKIVIENQS
jgi:phosphomannomutase